MGGGEVARYVARYGEDRLHSVVFAAAVPPYLLQDRGQPRRPARPGPGRRDGGRAGGRPGSFFDDFTTQFFSAGGELKVTEEQRQDAIALAAQSDQRAAVGCMASFGTTDFRGTSTRSPCPRS